MCAPSNPATTVARKGIIMSKVISLHSVSVRREKLRDLMTALALTPLALALVMALSAVTIATPGSGVRFAEHFQAGDLLVSVGTGLAYVVATRFRTFGAVRSPLAAMTSKGQRRLYVSMVAGTVMSYVAGISLALGLLTHGGSGFSFGVDLADLVAGAAFFGALFVAGWTSEVESPTR